MGRGREKLDGSGGRSNVNSVFNTKLSKHIKQSVNEIKFASIYKSNIFSHPKRAANWIWWHILAIPLLSRRGRIIHSVPA